MKSIEPTAVPCQRPLVQKAGCPDRSKTADGTEAGVSKGQTITYNNLMNACPYCHSKKNQVKAGRNTSGSQRYLCNNCQRIYTPRPNTNGYTPRVRQQAIHLYKQGMSFRAVARKMNVGTQSVINWVRQERQTPRSKHQATSDTGGQ